MTINSLSVVQAQAAPHGPDQFPDSRFVGEARSR